MTRHAWTAACGRHAWIAACDPTRVDSRGYLTSLRAVTAVTGKTLSTTAVTLRAAGCSVGVSNVPSGCSVGVSNVPVVAQWTSATFRWLLSGRQQRSGGCSVGVSNVPVAAQWASATLQWLLTRTRIDPHSAPPRPALAATQPLLDARGRETVCLHSSCRDVTCLWAVTALLPAAAAALSVDHFRRISADR